MTVLTPPGTFEVSVPVVVIGAGACGLTAALATREAGADVLVLERDPSPSGSTALSSGMIPAAGSRMQRAAGVADTPDLMARDIQAKARDRADPVIVAAATQESGPAVDWLSALPGIVLPLVQGFLYPGHSVERMHAPPSRTGSELIGMLLSACAGRQIDIMTDAHVTGLYAMPDGRVEGVRVTRPEGSVEAIGCAALVLACNGYGGNAEMVARFIPEMVEADYFGHAGNQGDAVTWGEALGGEAQHMQAYQGHGSVATPHGILITWALMMEGGIQVNADGDRFSNEHQGYSEQSLAVLAQPGRVAWNIYDGRLHELGLGFDDYRSADAQGAVKRAESARELASLLAVDGERLAASIGETGSEGNGSVRTGLRQNAEAGSAVLRREGHGCFVSHPGRFARRRIGAGIASWNRRPVAEPLCRGRGRLRRFRT